MISELVLAKTFAGLGAGLLGAAAFTTANWDVVGMTTGSHPRNGTRYHVLLARIQQRGLATSGRGAQVDQSFQRMAPMAYGLECLHCREEKPHL